jgi:hypothetical protein
MNESEIKDYIKKTERQVFKIKIMMAFLLVLIGGSIFTNVILLNKDDNQNHKKYKSYAGDTSTTSNSGIAYMVETGVGTGIYEQASDSTWPTDAIYNAEKSACEKGSTLSFDASTHKLTINSTKTDKCFVYFNKGYLLYNKILTDNGGATAISAKGTPSFSTVSTTNDGMYAAADDYGTSYYYRGAVNNNWVKFAGIYWRIIRINGDNTVRMIYSGTTAPTSSAATLTGTGTQINGSTYAFNSTYNSAEYVGYMYTLGDQHGYGTSSPIKSTIDTWYTSNLASYAAKIADSVYCNDRSTYSGTIAGSNFTGTGVGTTAAWFGGARRLINSSSWAPIGTGPSLSCPTQSDAFTVSDTTKGNAHLTNPVGLITADEVSMAGAIAGTGNSSYYLYTGQSYWTGSPYFYNGSYAFGFIVNSSGTLDNLNVNYARGVRPVVSLKSNIGITGSGTYNDPYLVN